MSDRRRCLAVVLALLVFGALPVPAAAQERQRPAATFDARVVEGWTVHIDVALVSERAELVERAIDHLENQLVQVTLVLGDEQARALREVPIWLRERKGGSISFHPARQWLVDRGNDPPQVPSMVELNASTFVFETRRQPWLVFHELTHGYDWFALGERRRYGNAETRRGFRRAMESGAYESALHWDGKRRSPYHATNAMEFLAETSEAYFGTNDIFPFVRAELRAHDPDTFAMVQRLWGVDAEAAERREAEAAAALESLPAVTGVGSDSARGASGARKPFAATSRYARREVEGWSVLVSPELAAVEPLAASVLALLRRDLHVISRYVPAWGLERLRGVPIWLELDNDRLPLSAYHASDRWLRAVGDNPEKAGAVEVARARRYLEWTRERQQAAVFLPLAHAFYERVLGRSHPLVHAAWSRARESETYDSVLRFDGRRVRHPGLADPRSFFAEMSEAAFGTNDHFPFVRVELRDVDTATYELLERLWKGEGRVRRF